MATLEEVHARREEILALLFSRVRMLSGAHIDNQNTSTRGLTLIEVLAVISVLVALAALLFPVYGKAKDKAQSAVCASRLHQASMATALYVQDHGEEPAGLYPTIGSYKGGKLIRWTSALRPYIPGSASILVCPLDKPAGRSQFRGDREVPRSYGETWFLWEGEEGREAWRRLLTLDPNATIFRCNLHTPRVRSMLLTNEFAHYYGNLEHGDALAVRKDGSVFLDTKSHYFPNPDPKDPEDMKRTLWSLATETECPKDLCDGKPLPEGLREP